MFKRLLGYAVIALAVFAGAVHFLPLGGRSDSDRLLSDAFFELYTRCLQLPDPVTCDQGLKYKFELQKRGIDPATVILSHRRPAVALPTTAASPPPHCDPMVQGVDQGPGCS